jgi:short-subunit dehydrogenase
MTENVLVVGATSGIARPLCRLLAERGCRLILAGRNLSDLEAMAADLSVRFGTSVEVEPFDALDFDGHRAFVDRCLDRFDDDLTGAVVCHGILPDQHECEHDLAALRNAMDVNFTSYASVLHLLAEPMEKRRQGWLCVISSVAGDRGRQSNYVYGATKAALSTFLEGLRNRLFKAGVHVLTVKPGMVDTPMTEGKINPKSPMVARPERVARDIDWAIRARRNVLYTPWTYSGVMGIIRSIPEGIFKRLKL